VLNDEPSESAQVVRRCASEHGIGEFVGKLHAQKPRREAQPTDLHVVEQVFEIEFHVAVEGVQQPDANFV
jgi:hypothetical protein